MKRHLLTILSLLLVFSTYAQNKFSITGILKDESNEAAIGATAQLKNSEGKTAGGSTTAEDGSFKISDVSPGKYTLTFSSYELKDIVKNVEIIDANIDLGTMKFESNATNLKTVEVKGARIAAKQNGDTKDYNADAFKVNPDATAEDLVRKMPGIDLSSGTVKAQGEKVGKVLVDGKAFFGDDASSTLKNLPAEVVNKIQVYDEKSEQSRLTGVDDGETIKAINIVTRAEKREGTFGKLYAGGGVDAQSLLNDGSNLTSDNLLYNIGGNVNSFKGDRRISIIGQSNNINIQNFGSQDLLGISSSSGGRGGGFGGGGGGNSSNNFMVGSSSGIATTNSIGINYSNKLGKKVEIAGSYFFNKTNTLTQQFTNRYYVSTAAAGQSYIEESTADATNFNHRFNVRLTYNIDSLNTLIWVPSLSLQKNINNSGVAGITKLIESPRNSTANNYSAKMNGYNYSNMLMYFHRFKKAGRSFNIHFNMSGNQNEGINNLYARNVYYTNIIMNDTLNQESDKNNTGNTYRTSVQYTEPITKESNIQIRYTNSYQKTDASKLTSDLDYNTNQNLGLNTLLSNEFTSIYKTNSVGLGYGYNNKLIRTNISADFQRATLNGERSLPSITSIDREFKNILPRAMMRINFSKSKNLGLFYRTSTDAPSITQLQDVIDNTNPLQLTSGNPNLKQSYTNNLFSRYTSTSSANNSTFFAMIRGTATRNYVGNSTIIANNDTLIENGISLGQGGQYTTQANLSGYYSVNGFTTYGTPITKLKSNINVNLSAGITRIPGLINNAKNYSNNRNVGLGFVFSSNISEKIDFTLSSNTAMNFVKNTLNRNADNNFLNQSTRLSANYIFWKGIVLSTEVNHQMYSGLIGDNSSQNYILWNAGLAKKFLKKQQAEVKLSVFDILGQNASFAQTYTEAYNQTVNTNVLQRYFMLTFTYNIRAFKGSSSEKDMETQDDKRRREMGGPPAGGHHPGSGGTPPPGGPGMF